MPENTGVTTPPVSPNQSNRTLLWVVLGVLIVVAGALGLIASNGGGAYLALLLGNEPTYEAVHDAGELNVQGDFAGAADLAGQIASETEDPLLRAVAHGVQAFGAVMSGSREDAGEVIENAKADYMNTSLPAGQRAAAINRILETLMTTRSTALAIQAFTGEPFQKFAVANDAVSSSRNLANESLALYPNTIATWYVALWDAARINNFDRNHKATAEEKKMHAEAVVARIKQAEEMWEIEKYAGGQTGNILAPTRYYYWKSFLYTVVASVEAEYFDEAEKSYQEGIDYFKNTRDAEGKTYPMIESRIPLTYIAYATLLNNSGGETRKEDVRKVLAEFMSVIQSNPGLHETGYVSTIIRIARNPKSDTRIYNNYVKLAATDPAFKAFLEGYGMRFE